MDRGVQVVIHAHQVGYLYAFREFGCNFIEHRVDFLDGLCGVRACGLEDERRNAGMTIDHTVISIGVLSQFNVCHIFQTQYLTVRSSSDYDLPELFRCHFTATVFHGILERVI